MLTPDQYYQAVLTRDPRFDGRFFVAVRTTRIYCRPICRVKTPLKKNCRFYPHAAAAEAAGYRPCKRCRPELAPGNSSMDAGSQLARSTAQLINQDFLADHSLEDLAQKLGVTDRQMRRVFHEEFGVSPVEFWQTQRLLLAKQLLTDSRMPVTTVAFASGFQSLRRFNALLKQRYRLSPTDLRKTHSTETPKNLTDFKFRLTYRPPFDWPRILNFLSNRAIPGVESVTTKSGGAYQRTVRIQRHDKQLLGHIQVTHEPDRNMLAVRLSDSLLPACATIIERIKRLFDLAADPQIIDAALRTLKGARPGLRLPGSFDTFEMATRAILGQQISVVAARTLAARLAQRFGDKLPGPTPSLTHVFPTAKQIAKARTTELHQLGILPRRAQTLIALAKAISTNKLSLEPGRRIEDTLDALAKIPGIGHWTAQYIAMRALNWPDAFPHTDLGIRKALNETDNTKILAKAEKWRPWRAYAAIHFWTQPETKP
jgi:AraC family transcriptional regulator of adaptative response / DNA-3-methyladenine glycosylase II